jgi:peptide/nickel transport system permease protein
MLRYAFARLIQFIPTLIGIYVLTFFLMRVLPGDPAQFLVGDRGDEQSLLATRVRLGIDQPLLAQFGIFVGDAINGNFGTSFITRRPVMDMINDAIGPTAVLGLAAMLVAVCVGIPLGLIAALNHNSTFDNISRIVALIGVSIPIFWLGLQFQVLFGLGLRILPVSGFGYDEHLILPAIAASLGMLAVLTRITRASLLEVLSQDYIRTAHSKGLSYRRVMLRHALSNALMPIVTVWGTGLAGLLSGTLLVEVIFSWPGMGRMLVDSISARDYPTVQGTVIVFAVIYAALNLLVDVLYPVFDPRIRYS